MIAVKKLCEQIASESEIDLLSFVITPVQKKDCVFIIVVDNERLYLLYGVYGYNEYIDFVREMIPEDAKLECFMNEIEISKDFIQSYRERFFKKIEIQDLTVKRWIDEVSNLDWSKIKKDCLGLDGFSLFAYNSKTNQESGFWCHYYADANIPLATLANYLLEYIDVDFNYRFSQCK